jgi:hypothetical protein
MILVGREASTPRIHVQCNNQIYSQLKLNEHVVSFLFLLSIFGTDQRFL